MMKKGYWVVAYRSVSDPSALQVYGAAAKLAIDAAGGKVLAAPGGAVVAHEAGVAQHTVIVEFASFELAQLAYAKDDYRASLRALGNGAERDFRIVEGMA
jgi:uncharacterized protein (DUF1330 family)